MYTLFVKVSAGHFHRVGVIYSAEILAEILEFNDFIVEFKSI
jgi:hypothetical protein